MLSAILLYCSWTCCRDSEQEISAELGSELGANDAVDEEVGGGVDDQKDVGHKSAKNTPNRKSSKRSVLAEFDGIQDEDLMHVED